MKFRLKFKAPSLTDLQSPDMSDEDREEIQKLVSTFFHKQEGVPSYIKVSFDTKKRQAKVIMPKNNE